MPCSDSLQQADDDFRELKLTTELLCWLCRELDQTLTGKAIILRKRELLIWWSNHKKIDEERRKERKERKEEKKLAKKLLLKLTPKEIRAIHRHL